MQYFSKSEIDLATVRRNFEEGKLYIDKSYQRRKVWNLEDNVRLIETILLNYIVPPVFFWNSERDNDTGIALTHIVDGQQRITAIVEYLNDAFALSEKYLLSAEIKKKYGGLKFSELDNETRKIIWGYRLSVIDIDSSCDRETIKNMFARLNLTNYSLNNQERRKGKNSSFGDKCEALSTYDFWEKLRVFSAKDAKRMLDVEFCCGIYILANEFISNQTDETLINTYYDDYADEFDQDEELLKKIEFSMDNILALSNRSTVRFIQKKAQVFTLFSLFIRLYEEKVEIDESFVERFSGFVEVYSVFRNEYVYQGKDSDCANLYEKIKRYKQASSFGVNKLSSRMIRYEILNDIYSSNKSLLVALDSLKECFMMQQAKTKDRSFEEDDIIDEG